MEELKVLHVKNDLAKQQSVESSGGYTKAVAAIRRWQWQGGSDYDAVVARVNRERDMVEAMIKDKRMIQK